MKQRVFLAIGMSVELKTLITTWQKKNAHLPVRFISPDNLHLTVLPPWYADPQRVIAKLRNFSSDVKPFTLHFHTIEKRPRLVWVKGEFSTELAELAQSLAIFLHRTTEKRPLVPHITLARYKNRPFSFSKESVRWSLHVQSFILMKSTLSPQGANYQILARYFL